MLTALSAFALVWIPFFALASPWMVGDNIEQLTWVRQLHWGYYKHPPLPTVLLWPFVQVFGLHLWVTHMLAACITLGSIALLWGYLLPRRGAAHAGVAALAALCMTYSSGSLTHLNHNTVLLLFHTLSALTAVRALSQRSLPWYGLLGLTLGLGALSKYQVVVTVACLLCWVALSGAWRAPFVRRGLALSAAVAAVVFLPHLIWAWQNDFPTVRYATQSAIGAGLPLGGRISGGLHWLADQLFNRLLPAWLLLLAVAWPWRGRRASMATPAALFDGTARALAGGTASASRPADDGTRLLLSCWAAVPLLFVPLMGVLTGSELRMHWATPFLIFAVPAAMEWLPAGRWSQASASRALATFAVLQALTLGVMFRSWQANEANSGAKTPERPSGEAMAGELAAPARDALKGPIRVISGRAEVAGALALSLAERPLVLIDGNARLSPWVPPGLVDRCGLVVIAAATGALDERPLGGRAKGWAWRVVQPTRSGDCGRHP